ncbi:spermosin-like [Melanaphis sacchari]|nr:spermosin-like [Melanaphis sacchari]
MNYIMQIFGLILFTGIVSSLVIGPLSVTHTTVIGFLASELQSTTGLKLTTILETTTLTDENDDDDCNCTPYHQCKTYKAAPDGNELIDVRINVAPCQSYFDVCCNDTKITSTEKYQLNNPDDTTSSNCNCVSPEDYSKEPIIDQIDVTKKPSYGSNEDYTKKPFDEHTEGYTKEPHVSNNEDYTKKPYDGQTDEHTKKPYDGHTGDYTKEPYDGKTDEYTKKPYDGQTDEHTKKPYDGQTDEHTKKPYDSQTEDYTKNPHDGQKDEYTKKPYDGQTEDYTKNPHDGQSGYFTKEPSVHEVTEKSITPEYIVSTESDKTSNDHHEKHKCGTWNKYGAGFRIGNAVDGESQFGEFPSMIAIFKEELSKDGEKNLVLNCGGSLIEKDVILTAAHCVIKKDISTLVVRAGEWDLKTEKELLSHQDRRVSKIVTHPDYYAGGLYNDVALIFVENPFSLQDNIQLICLPSTNDIFINDMCYSSGWGKTVSYNNYTIVKKTESGKTKEFGQYQVSILKKVELPIVPRSKCMDILRTTRLGPKFVLHDSFICAGGQEGKDTCKGDGGSPLMCPYKDDPDHLVQVGIVAWGINCGLADIPAAYVNVAGFMYWIKNEIEKRGY